MTDAKVTVESQSASKSRLMILKLTIENFKSYGGVKEIGPFHKSFSSVVGPNGSGKSNVIDAMLFVFGKKASKLRLNRVRSFSLVFGFPLLRLGPIISFFLACWTVL